MAKKVTFAGLATYVENKMDEIRDLEDLAGLDGSEELISLVREVKARTVNLSDYIAKCLPCDYELVSWSQAYVGKLNKACREALQIAEDYKAISELLEESIASFMGALTHDRFVAIEI